MTSLSPIYQSLTVFDETSDSSAQFTFFDECTHQIAYK